MSENFFSRWSRRKQAVAAQDADRVTESSRSEPETVTAIAKAGDTAHATAHAQDLTAPSELPTLEDVRQLTPESDFQPFMQSGVGTEVRNAAMKKLFADPHFNVMDGLDIYIDDYSQPDPMPAGMLRKMASAQFLKLVPEAAEDSERPAQDPADRGEPQLGEQVVAQSPDSLVKVEPPQHDHSDLQLQPDPAATDRQAGPGPR